MIQARGKLPDVHVVQWLGMFWLDFGRCSRSTWWNVSYSRLSFELRSRKNCVGNLTDFLLFTMSHVTRLFFQRMRLMSRQMERMRRIVEARKYCKWIRLPFRKHCFQSEAGGERERPENICQLTILQVSVTTGNVIGCGIYQDKLYHHRDSITLQEFPVIRAR